MDEGLLALLSGLVGALVATFVTLIVGGWREKRRQKLSLLSDLVANRHHISGDKFSCAMNGVLAAFADSPDVLRAHEELYAALSSDANREEANRRLSELWRSMARSARVSTRRISDAQFLRVMNPRE